MNVWPLATVAAGALLAAALARKAAPPPPSLPDEEYAAWGDWMPESDQTNDLFDEAVLTMDPRNLLPLSVAPDRAAQNLRAVLDAIAWAEGTAGRADDGYNVMFGYRTFASYADHPRQYFSFVNTEGVTQRTSAAGRYQFIVPTWDSVAAKLRLPDFSPASQDAGAIELIRQKGALRDAQEGRLALCIDKIRRVWASLPGAGYPQRTRSFETLTAAYLEAGGTLQG